MEWKNLTPVGALLVMATVITLTGAFDVEYPFDVETRGRSIFDRGGQKSAAQRIMSWMDFSKPPAVAPTVKVRPCTSLES